MRNSTREKERAEDLLEANQSMRRVPLFIREDLTEATSDLATAFEDMADFSDEARQHFDGIKDICKDAQSQGHMHRPVFYQAYTHKVADLKSHLQAVCTSAKRLDRL